MHTLSILRLALAYFCSAQVRAFVLSPLPPTCQTTRQTVTATTTTTTTLHVSKNSSNNNNENNENKNKTAWQSHVSTHADPLHAWNKLWNDISGPKETLDLAFLFVSQAHATDFSSLVEQAYCQLQGHGIRLVSILGGGVIGDNVEVDQPQRPSMSLLIGGLPDGAELKIVHYSNNENNGNDKEDATQSALQLEERFSSCLVFCDPWAPVENILAEYLQSPGRVIAGGISCPSLADQSSLAVDHKPLPQGSMMGVAFAGTLGLQTMVAQGCRPVGRLHKITDCNGNVITRLDGKPALQVLQQLANTAPREEQEQISSGLLCGISAKSTSKTITQSNKNMDGEQEEESIDFLSRQIIGFVPSEQGIAIGTSQIETGDLFCFQVRDGTTAQQDLKLMVQRTKAARLFDNVDGALSDMDGTNTICRPRKSHPVAALQISCVARGRGMFGGVPNVDLSNVKRAVETLEQPRAPIVAGFFANGEIGPVGLAGFSTTKKTDGKSFLHSFTTVAAILCEYEEMNDTANNNSNSDHESGVVQEESMDAWG